MRFSAAIPLAALSLLLISTTFGVSAQDDSDAMHVDVEMSISGLETLSSSGSASFEFTGAPSTQLRRSIINEFDTPGSPDQIINAAEIRSFMTAFSRAVQGRSYWGMVIDESTNFSEMTPNEVADGTDGLLLTTWDTNEPIVFSINFESSTSTRTKAMDLAQSAYSAFAGAIYEVTGYAFNGTFALEHYASAYVIGSYTDPDLAEGGLSELRVPWGMFIWYSFEGQVGPTTTIADTITFEGFSAVENQLIGGIVVIIGCYLLIRIPGRRFDKYEKLHPRKFRKYAKPLLSVNASAYILVAVLAVLYLFPYIFSWASPEFMFYTAYLYVIVPAAIIGEMLFSKAMYDKAGEAIPEESVIEIKQAIVEPTEEQGEMLCKICYRPIEAGLELLECSCGARMHASCAQTAPACPACGQPLIQVQTRSIQCRSCGETFLYSGEGDVYSIQCSMCGAFQEEIKAGRNYLVADEDARNAFMMVKAMAMQERPAMCATTSFPGKVRSDYDLHDVPIRWFSDSTTDIDNINPKDLEGDALEALSTFLMTTKNAGVLVEGIESLVEQNGFEKVLAFLKKLNDLASIHSSTIILYVNKKLITEDQYKTISEEFDELHDYQ